MLLAHQGGWDELLITLGPVVVIVAVLLATSWRAAGDDDETTDETTREAHEAHETTPGETTDDRSS